MQRKLRLGCRSLILAALVTFALPAAASDAGPGVVSDLQVEGTRVAFLLSGPRTTRPSCVVWDRFVFDLTTPGAEAMFAYLLSARATQQSIRVIGTHSCNIVADHENAAGFRDAG